MHVSVCDAMPLQQIESLANDKGIKLAMACNCELQACNVRSRGETIEQCCVGLSIVVPIVVCTAINVEVDQRSRDQAQHAALHAQCARDARLVCFY